MEVPAWTYRFLIEVWAEPRSAPELPARVRARVRDMERERERYVGSVGEIAAVIDERLDDAGIVPRAWERDS